MKRTRRKSFHPNNRATGNDTLPLLLKHTCIGSGLALLGTAVLLLVSAALCLRASNPSALIPPLGLIMFFLSFGIAGFITLRLHHEALIPCGLLCGVLLNGFFGILSLFLSSDDVSSVFSFPFSLLLRAFGIVLALLGALIALKARRSARHR